MQIEVKCHVANLCACVRESLEAEKYSHLKVLNAVNAHLGKMHSKQTGEDKRGNARGNAKKDTLKITVKPGSVEFTGTFDIVGTFIAWHDAIAKAANITSMDNVGPIPTAFHTWLQFAKAEEKTPQNEPANA